MMLNTKNLKVGYGKKTVVAGINIEAMKGQFICLLGPNGSGKSTILKTIVRMLVPLGGEVYLNERNISGLSNLEMAKTTAVVLTETITPGLMTAYDVVMLGRHPYTGFTGKPTGEDSRKVLDVLQMVNAADLAQRYFSELSDGEKQKTMLARALAQEPQLIVLDEPTSHLDARHRIEVMLILRQLTQKKEVTVIASLHDIDLVMKVCDIAILIKDEHILACGVPEDVLSETAVAQLYDMDKAAFSSYLGGVELRGNGHGPVYVVAGGGSGARLYRSLVKHGFNIITGVLPENDLDYYIARAVGANVVSEKPYNEISPDAYAQAQSLMSKNIVVIDAGFPIGSANKRNIDLVGNALESGHVTYTLRKEDEAAKIYGDTAAARFVYCESLSQLLEAILRTENSIKQTHLT
ncbi:MAG: ABC transporter ATP-binding protein [Dehalococcoidales bacterium]|nr:ABC transporter ATP-binding protein [Dehalococcoidales bacterium]